MMSLLHTYANPARLMRLLPALQKVFGFLTPILLVGGLYAALVMSPPDYQQGETVRIMYVHVPSAWMALFIYAGMTVAALSSVIWRHRVADIYIRAVAPVGAAFTLICLITGSLWGQPMWGTWWVWDARLTSVLILFLIYLGYIALVQSFDDEDKGLTVGRYLVLIGSINLPIIKYSVEWWNTLHQPASISRLQSPAIDPAMLPPLLLMALAFLSLFIFLAALRLETALLLKKGVQR